MGNGWARVGSVPPAGMGPCGEQNITRTGLSGTLSPLVVFSQHLVCIPRIFRGQSWRGDPCPMGPILQVSRPRLRGCAGQNSSTIYHLRCGVVLGMGERLMGGGEWDRPLPEERACALFLAGCHRRQRAVAVHTRRQTSSSY